MQLFSISYFLSKYNYNNEILITTKCPNLSKKKYIISVFYIWTFLWKIIILNYNWLLDEKASQWLDYVTSVWLIDWMSCDVILLQRRDKIRRKYDRLPESIRLFINITWHCLSFILNLSDKCCLIDWFTAWKCQGLMF